MKIRIFIRRVPILRVNILTAYFMDKNKNLYKKMLPRGTTAPRRGSAEDGFFQIFSDVFKKNLRILINFELEIFNI